MSGLAGEAIAGVIVIGYSVDYVVHLAHMYCEAKHFGHETRIRLTAVFWTLRSYSTPPLRAIYCCCFILQVMIGPSLPFATWAPPFSQAFCEETARKLAASAFALRLW